MSWEGATEEELATKGDAGCGGQAGGLGDLLMGLKLIHLQEWGVNSSSNQ